MDWKHLKKTYREGLILTPTLQQAWYAAYLVHLAAGKGLLPEAGIFTRCNASRDTFEFYFTPQTIGIMGSIIDVFGALPCEKPPFRLPDDGRWDGLRLTIGETSARGLLDDGED